MPTFTDTEKEQIREVLQLKNTAANLTALNDVLATLNTAQYNACIADITAWTDVRFGTVKVKGGTDGKDYSLARERLQITNRMRDRLGYDRVALDSSDVGNSEDIIHSFTITLPGSFSYITSPEDEYIL